LIDWLRVSCSPKNDAIYFWRTTTLPKCSRFILHPLKQIKARSLRVAVVVVFVIIVIIVIFFAVAFVFLFVFFLVGLLSKEDIGRPIRRV
jgi:hypothetical protein